MCVVKGDFLKALWPLAMVAAGVGIAALAFVPEARIARRIITSAFDVSADAASAPTP